MPSNPPAGFPRVTPYLYYEDAGAAVDFLIRAFGFTERVRMKAPDGKVMHAELAIADGVVMLGHPGPDYKSPKRLGGVTQNVYVYVDRVDDHFAKAKAAGAKITAAPEDQFYGDRRYAAEDPEGHQWFFATHVRDVSPDEMKKHGA